MNDKKREAFASRFSFEILTINFDDNFDDKKSPTTPEQLPTLIFSKNKKPLKKRAKSSLFNGFRWRRRRDLNSLNNSAFARLLRFLTIKTTKKARKNGEKRAFLIVRERLDKFVVYLRVNVHARC